VTTRPPALARTSEGPDEDRAATTGSAPPRHITAAYLMRLMTTARHGGSIAVPPGAMGTVADAIRAAQGSIGNQAVGLALSGLGADAMAVDPAAVVDASLEPATSGAEHEPARDPHRPAPADPAAPPGSESDTVEPSAGAEAPPHAAGAAPAPGPTGSGGGAPSAAPVVVSPSAPTAAAVADSAAATASAMPRPAPGGGASAGPAPARPPASRRAAARRIPGPPPIPTVEPSFAHVSDPIEPATRRIEEVANRLLPDQEMPAVEASPGGHTPVVPDQSVSESDRRLILLDEPAMDTAGLSRSTDAPTASDPHPGGERTRLLDLRNRLLAPPAPAVDGAAPAPVVAAPIRVTTPPLPAADVTLAEQQLFASVLARLMVDPAQNARRILDDVKEHMREYPGGALNSTQHPALHALGEDQLDGLQTRVSDRINATARVMGAAGAVLDTAVAARRQQLDDIAAGRTAAVCEATDGATAAAAASADVRLGDAAAARSAATDARRRAASAGPAPTPGFREIAEAAVARIQAKVSEAIAGFRLQERERHRDLDAARDRLVSAYELAVVADEIAAQQENNLGPSQTPPSGVLELASARRRVNTAINRAREWKDTQVQTLTAQVRRMKADVTATINANIRDVEDQGASAFRELHTWGDTQEGANEQWWTDTVTRLDGWAERAHDTATTWADAEARLARLELQRELQRIRMTAEEQINADADSAAGYARLSEGQKRNYIVNIVSTMHEPDFISQMGEHLFDRQIEMEKASIEPAVESQLGALPRGNWADIEFAAKAKNPSFDAAARANAIYSAGYDKVGTDESTIYQQLQNLRPIELDAVTKKYNDRRGSDTALYDDLDSELSGDEWRRAQDLMAGDPGAAAAEAIHDAVWGPGTNEAQIMEVLRGLNNLPADQRDAARARVNQIYLERYGESLDTVLRGDLSGSELGQAQALSEGRMADAEAYEVDYALRGGWSRDAGAAAAVYDRIRTESMELARENNWTAAEFDAEVARRNAALDSSFGQQFSTVSNYNWGSGSTLENAIGYTFAFDRGNRDMLNAYATGDVEGIDAGRMEAERNGTYADDEVMGGVVRAQFTRAMDRVQLDRGPELRAGVDARLRTETDAARAAGTPLTPRQIMDRRMELDRERDATMADEAFDRSRAGIARLDARLQDRYGITFDDMLTSTMSDNTFGQGGALSDARGRLEIMRRDASSPAYGERRLDWAYARVRFGIEGAGTDMGELRGGLAGLTQEEMQDLDNRWRGDHMGETLREAIQGDTSGREEDDLVDQFDHGAPTTSEGRVKELRRRLARDEASVGFWGASESQAESAESHRALSVLEGMNAELDDPNLSPERRAHLSAAFDQRVDHAGAAIEAQRARVDSFADTITTILQYVVGAIAIIAGAVVSIVSGGTALPAVIAIAGSLLGTLSGIAAKAAIKGGAYGAEEIGTDIAVGAVDLAVTMATLGLFKGGQFLTNARVMLANAGAQLREVTRASIRMGLSRAAQRITATAAEQAVEGGLRRSAASRVLSAGRSFAGEQLHQALTAVPTALTANLLNEQNWRHGNLAANLVRGTWEASIENLKNGVVMGAAGSVVHAGLSHMIEPGRFTPVEARAREYRMWRDEHPTGSRAEYTAQMEARAAAESAHADAVRAATREARRALLSEVPPAERGAIADVPIMHVDEGQFRTLNGGNYGDVLVHVHEGQTVIIVRDGAPPTALRGLAAEVRAVVAPGTGGRTVNPVDSLPPRLRNRVGVEVVRDPGFGLDEVRAVPHRDQQGNITGVTLQVGPNARAADIRNHVDTVDAMRRYVGAAGRARLLLNDLGRSMGIDLVSPRERGRWEASLEVAKLPRIIEERIARLSEHGLDPRRRAQVMDEIASLEAQLASERQRLALGAEAQERGHVAARSKRGTAVPEDPAAVRERQRAQDLLIELGEASRIEIETRSERDRLDAPMEKVEELIENRLDRVNDRRLEPARQMLEEGRRMDALRALEAAFRDQPELNYPKGDPPTFGHAMRDAVLDALAMEPVRQAQYRDIDRRLSEAVARAETLRSTIAEGGYNRFAGDGRVPVHSSLPVPLAGWDYFPRAEPGRVLTPQEQQALANNQNGFISELRLANRIAESGEVVIMYGHKINEHGADLVSIDPVTGRLTLWDSKYHSTPGTGHSDTFEVQGRREDAVKRIQTFLTDRRDSLPAALHDRALKALASGDLDMVTAHTTGGGFTDRRIVHSGGKEISRS